MISIISNLSIRLPQHLCLITLLCGVSAVAGETLGGHQLSTSTKCERCWRGRLGSRGSLGWPQRRRAQAQADNACGKNSMRDGDSLATRLTTQYTCPAPGKESSQRIIRALGSCGQVIAGVRSSRLSQYYQLDTESHLFRLTSSQKGFSLPHN